MLSKDALLRTREAHYLYNVHGDKALLALSGTSLISVNALLVLSRLYRQLKVRRALLQIKDVPLRTRRALLLYKVYGDSAFLVLNGTALICNNALVALQWRYARVHNLQPFAHISQTWTVHTLRGGHISLSVGQYVPVWVLKLQANTLSWHKFRQW